MIRRRLASRILEFDAFLLVFHSKLNLEESEFLFISTFINLNKEWKSLYINCSFSVLFSLFFRRVLTVNRTY